MFYFSCRISLINRAIDNITNIWSEIESAPHTLIHNDCNPRNICLRHHSIPQQSHSNTTPQGQQTNVDNNSGSIPYQDHRTLCMYDWELATVGVPQYDVVEFLCFTLLPSTPHHVWLHLLEFYQSHLEYYSGVKFPPKK